MMFSHTCLLLAEGLAQKRSSRIFPSSMRLASFSAMIISAAMASSALVFPFRSFFAGLLHEFDVEMETRIFRLFFPDFSGQLFFVDFCCVELLEVVERCVDYFVSLFSIIFLRRDFCCPRVPEVSLRLSVWLGLAFACSIRQFQNMSVLLRMRPSLSAFPLFAPSRWWR